MSTATISIDVESSVKKAAAANAKAAGVDLTTIFRSIVNRLAKEPAAAYEYHYPNAETRKAIREAEQGIGLHRVNSIEELRKAVDWD